MLGSGPSSPLPWIELKTKFWVKIGVCVLLHSVSRGFYEENRPYFICYSPTHPQDDLSKLRSSMAMRPLPAIPIMSIWKSRKVMGGLETKNCAKYQRIGRIEKEDESTWMILRLGHWTVIKFCSLHQQIMNVLAIGLYAQFMTSLQF